MEKCSRINDHIRSVINGNSVNRCDCDYCRIYTEGYMECYNNPVAKLRKLEINNGAIVYKLEDRLHPINR